MYIFFSPRVVPRKFKYLTRQCEICISHSDNNDEYCPLGYDFVPSGM